MTILATTVFAPRRTLWGQLVCGRCGIEYDGNPRSAQAAYCRDCRPEARQLGWHDQPARRTRAKETA